MHGNHLVLIQRLGVSSNNSKLHWQDFFENNYWEELAGPPSSRLDLSEHTGLKWPTSLQIQQIYGTPTSLQIQQIYGTGLLGGESDEWCTQCPHSIVLLVV
jgi:hypothetical protein